MTNEITQKEFRAIKSIVSAVSHYHKDLHNFVLVSIKPFKCDKCPHWHCDIRLTKVSEETPEE